MVKISVIIPVYNVEKYLDECLNSVINQTFADMEIICVNDGSTDRSLDILNDYREKDSRIRIITQPNMGLASARNTGLENASGKYVYFIDSDDYLALDGLEKMYGICEDKRLDLLIFKLMTFDNMTGDENYEYSNMPFLLDIAKDVFSYSDFKNDLLKVDVTVYTKFFKRDLIHDKRFPDGLIFEDNAFYFDYIFDAKRIHFLDECLYYKRLRSDSIILKGSKNYTDLMEIYRLIYQKVKSYGMYGELREDLFMRKVDSIYYRFKLINPKYKEEYYNLMKKDFLNQKEEYENEFDLEKISDYVKRIFKSVIKSSEYGQIDSLIRLDYLTNRTNSLEKENKKLQNENEQLKRLNQSLLSSTSWKITEPLRKLKRKL